MRVYAARFSDGSSIKGDAMEDLKLVKESSVFADGMTHNASRGDVIVVYAKTYVVILRVRSENLGPTTMWLEKGGQFWPNSYEVSRITLFMRADSIQGRLEELCVKHGVPFRGKNGNILLFHGNRFNGGNDKSQYSQVVSEFIMERRAAFQARRRAAAA